MLARSHSSSGLLHAVLHGRARRGTAIGPRELDFDGYVVAFTRPGAPRMPNGIECDVQVSPKDRVSAGDGRLHVGRLVIDPGPAWNPVPAFERARMLAAGPPPLPSALLASVELLCGYAAGLTLLHGHGAMASRLARSAGEATDHRGSTLLRHAALGEVPEAVHALLLHGDPGPLLAQRTLDGAAWMRGLVSAGYSVDVQRLHSAIA